MAVTPTCSFYIIVLLETATQRAVNDDDTSGSKKAAWQYHAAF
jgi:hypothetical protein